MKPNILLIVVDGLRADRCSGSNRTAITPNIDSLIKNGTYFSQAISSSDGTFTCVGSLLSSCYPTKSGITTFHNHKKSTVNLEEIIKQDYKCYITAPNVSFFQTMSSKFIEKDLYDKPYVYLKGGTGNSILKVIEKLTEPWFYYLHIMDLHRSVEFALPNEFKDKKFGVTDYDKMVSYIDEWLGKILKNINLENTLVVFTSDHGDFIPIPSINHEINFIPNLVDKSRKIKKIMPNFLEPLGLKVYLVIRYFSTKIRTKKFKKELTETEMRTLSIRGHKSMNDLFDEIFRIPLLLVGPGIEKEKEISKLVRQIDIFPTILELIKIDHHVQTDGKSLQILLNGQQFTENPAFIENMSVDENKNGQSIGIRTSKFKYYRNRENSKKRVVLYDIEKDPNELKNIAIEEPKIVKKMEKLLEEFLKDESNIKPKLRDDDKTEIIKDELKKMGYI